MAQPYLSQITMFSGNFAPRGYALCNGQIMSIQQNTALFSLLGTVYGGNGVQTFALPNLQSSLPLCFGNGPGLSPYVLGQVAGSQGVTLQQSQTPPHAHSFMCSTSAANTTGSAVANNRLPGTPSAGTSPYLYANPPQQNQPPLQPHTLAAGVVPVSGQSQPHSNLMPSLCVTFLIALTGVFPSRN